MCLYLEFCSNNDLYKSKKEKNNTEEKHKVYVSIVLSQEYNKLSGLTWLSWAEKGVCSWPAHLMYTDVHWCALPFKPGF